MYCKCGDLTKRRNKSLAVKPHTARSTPGSLLADDQISDLHLCCRSTSDTQRRTADQTSPSSEGEDILLCSAEINAGPFKWKGFLCAQVITRCATRVLWGGFEEKNDRQVLKFKGWGRKEVKTGMCWNRGGTPGCCGVEGRVYGSRVGTLVFVLFVSSGRGTRCQTPKAHPFLGQFFGNGEVIYVATYFFFYLNRAPSNVE